jgi:hypothetical protein
LQFNDIQRGCGIHEYGEAVAVYHQLQTCRAAFNQLRVNDEGVLLLPATLHAEAPERHVPDSAALARRLASL